MAGEINKLIPLYGELNRIYNDWVTNYAFSFDKQKFITDFYRQHNDTKAFVVNSINDVPELEVQYFEIVDGLSLQSLENWDDSDYVVGCITVFCGSIPVRLIDNIKYKEPK